MAGSPQILASFHPKSFNKNHRPLARDSDPGWISGSYDLDVLLQHIAAGRSWTNCLLIGGIRRSENAGTSNSIIVDIDGDLTLDEFWAIPAVQKHCVATATTCSHRPESHRFRAIFLIANHEGDKLHKQLYGLLIDALGVNIKDRCGNILTLPWFGNSNTEIRRNPDATELPWDWIGIAQDLVAEEERINAERLKQSIEGFNAGWEWERDIACYLLDEILDTSQDGQYNDYWVRVMGAAASCGDDTVWEAAMVWHFRGHHGKTQKGVDRRRTKFGKNISLTYLRSQANKQHPDWFKNLPEHLKPKRQITPPLLSSPAPIETIGGGPGPVVSAAPVKPSSIASNGGPSSFLEPKSTPVAMPPVATAPAPLVSSAAPIESAEVRTGGMVTPEMLEQTARMYDMVRRLYRLISEQILETPSGDLRLTQADAAQWIDRYESDLLQYPLFQRNPSRLQTRLLDLFAQQQGIPELSISNLKPEPLYADNDDEEPEPLIQNLLAVGATYYLYARQGIGKTQLALFLARACVGTPGHNSFLGFPAVPITEYGKRRVLYIASDGDMDAKTDIKRYLSTYGIASEEWAQRYVRFLAPAYRKRSSRWRMHVQGLLHLAAILDEARQTGQPYSLLIVDSLKACVPPGIRVGSQEIVEYIQKLTQLCKMRNVTILFLHHQSKEGETAQGVTALLEEAHGVFRLRIDDEDKLHRFCIDKTRMDPRGRGELAYKISPSGSLDIALPADEEIDGDMKIIREALLRHYQQHCKKIAHLSMSDPLRHYDGIRATDLYSLLRSYGLSHPKLNNERSCADCLRAMNREGMLQQVKSPTDKRSVRYTLAGLHLDLTGSAEAADEQQQDIGLPGWDT